MTDRLFQLRRLCHAGAAILIALSWSPIADAVTNAVVERGRYLAIAGNCVACHTKPGGKPHAGGLKFDTPFGVLYSTNITPDRATGIGNWSLAQFSAALRSGTRPNGEHLYPVFPYTAYTKLTDADVAALYAYFKSLKPVSQRPPANEMRFPFGERALLGPWKSLFFEDARFVRKADRSAEWNRGAYLVEALGHCSACHSPRNALGAEDTNLLMTGGVHAHTDADGRTRQWAASNLTNSPAGLAAWTVDDLSGYLHRGISPRAAVFGPMNEVVASLSQLPSADVRAMAVYLKSLPANRQKVKSETLDVDTMSEGRILYNIHCGTCHQPEGTGGSDTGPPLAGSAVVNAPSHESLVNIILRGPDRPKVAPSAEWQKRRWKMMESFGDKLGDDEVAAIATYVRNSWGHTGAAVTEESVARQR
jgi:mono/diheme cytochrome c family protein